MAEEQKLHEHGGHRLCVNNCGFFGSPTTLNLCSKCYQNHNLKEKQMKEAKVAMEKTLMHSEESASSSSRSAIWSLSSLEVSSSPPPQTGGGFEQGSVNQAAEPVARPNRCSMCRKRVGLMGFTCKCGVTFCGGHRYPEQHACTFDYKGVGKEAIANANPVVKAAKLDKI